MLNIDHAAHFTRPVTFPVPNGPEAEPQTATVTFNVLRISQVRSFDFATAEGVDSILDASVREIGDLQDGHGNPVPWSAEVKKIILDQPWARNALITAYWSGSQEDALKN